MQKVGIASEARTSIANTTNPATLQNVATLRSLIRARKGSVQIGNLTAVMCAKRPQGQWNIFNPSQVMEDRGRIAELALRQSGATGNTAIAYGRADLIWTMVKQHPLLATAGELMHNQSSLGVPEMQWSQGSLPMAALRVVINRETDESMYLIMIPTEIISLYLKVKQAIETKGRGEFGGEDGIFFTSRANLTSVNRHCAVNRMMELSGTYSVMILKTSVQFSADTVRLIQSLPEALKVLPELLPQVCGPSLRVRLVANNLPYTRAYGELPEGKYLLVLPNAVRDVIHAARNQQA